MLYEVPEMDQCEAGHIMQAPQIDERIGSIIFVTRGYHRKLRRG